MKYKWFKMIDAIKNCDWNGKKIIKREWIKKFASKLCPLEKQNGNLKSKNDKNWEIKYSEQKKEETKIEWQLAAHQRWTNPNQTKLKPSSNDMH